MAKKGGRRGADKARRGGGGRPERGGKGRRGSFAEGKALEGTVSEDGRTLLPAQAHSHTKSAGKPGRGAQGQSLGRKSGLLYGPGDTVLARPGREGKGLEVCAVLQRVQRRYFGVLQERKGKLQAVLINPRVGAGTWDLRLDGRALGKGEQPGAGSLVEVELPEANPKGRKESGRIRRCFGQEWEPGAVREMAMRAYGLPPHWEVQQGPGGGPDWQPKEQPEQGGREDAEQLPLVTIDGEDAKDFDDAVAVRRDGQGGWTAWVAIADVSHYVRPGSPIDQGALERGNSAYFLDRALPMLPAALSEDLCSLRPRERRRAALCRMEFDASGRRTAAAVSRVWIRSRARLTYEQVGKAWDLLAPEQAGKLAEQLQVPEEAAQSLAAARELTAVLGQNRLRQGAVQLHIPEPVLDRDADGQLLGVGAPAAAAGLGPAQNLIEELMLAANIAVAEQLAEQRSQGAIYRIHESPDGAKFGDMVRWLEQLEGMGPGSLQGVSPTAEGLRELLQKVDAIPARDMAHELVRNSMAQAQYAAGEHARECGHFALQCQRYTHFTSPIRRYVDLMVHRQLFSGGSAAEEDQAMHIAAHCSQTERLAQRCEGFVRRFLLCELANRSAGKKVQVRLQKVEPKGVEFRVLAYGEDAWMPAPALYGRFGRYPDPEQGVILEDPDGGRPKVWLRLGQTTQMVLEGAEPIRRRVRLAFRGPGRR